MNLIQGSSLINNILPDNTSLKNIPTSLFETNNPPEPPSRSMQSVLQERDVLFTASSPGSFTFHEGKNVSNNNMNSVFKNETCETLLTELFYSKKNIDTIQNLIGHLVNKETGYVISRQDDDELLIIMRATYIEYSQHPPLLTRNDKVEKRKELIQMYVIETQRLNGIILDTVVPKVISEIQQYISYRRDSSTQPSPISLPQFSSSKGERDYRSPTQVFFGGNF
jgi:hypothetical protein